MNIPHQGRRIVWLVWLLAAIGLLIGAVTFGLVGWTLSRVRAERTRAAAQQERLVGFSQALRERAVEGRAEIQTILDETAAWTNQLSSATGPAEFIRAHLVAEGDRALLPPLNVLLTQASRLVEFRGRAANWRGSYSMIWDDLSQQKTAGRMRSLIARLRTAVETREGQSRLEAAIKHRRWREAGAEDAARLAREILLEQGREQSGDSADFKNQLAEFGQLVEVLGGEEQFDNLADLKDNRLKPALDRMSHSITVLSGIRTGTDDLTPETVDRLRGLLFGEGFTRDEAHQTVQAGRGGLFALRRDALRLRRERERLKNELAALFQNIESANADYSRSAALRTAALTGEIERSLASGWRRMFFVGGGCSVLFLWIALLISRGISSQVNALDQARAEAELGRQKTHQLMVEQQAAAGQLAAAHQEVQSSEQRFRMLSTSAPIGIFETDAAGDLLYSNPCWQNLAGLSLTESLGEGWKRAIHPDDAAEVFSTWKSAVHEGREYHREFRFRTPGGEVRWVHGRATSIRSRTGELAGYVGTAEDVTERKRAEVELEQAHRELVESSRLAGMAEVATGVLHNVGNALNSVNVSSTCLADSIKRSQVSNLPMVVALLNEHTGDLGAFLTCHPKGKKLLVYLTKLSEHLASEQSAALKELSQLQKYIEHIKDIVTMQQSFAKVSGVTETLQASDLVEDALRMNASSLSRHDIQVIKQFDTVPPIITQRPKIMQILVNLVRNAKHACEESGLPEKRMTLRISNEIDRVRISVSDNGVGISPENLNRIFAHGFTTKKDGHGFGLHSGALAAKEMGGALSVQSDGVGKGANFTLELPKKPQLPAAAAAGGIPSVGVESPAPLVA